MTSLRGRDRVLSRRLFLQLAGAAAVGSGLPACAEPQPSKATTPNRLRVQAIPGSDPLVARTLAILKNRIEERGAARVVEVGRRPQVILTLDSRLAAEAFRIDAVRGAVRVAGGSPSGLLYGVGKFLRTSGYEGAFQPSGWRGLSMPQGPLRGMYFASHFHNWYVQASDGEIARYLEDMALWGVNVVKVIFPLINLRDWDDPEAGPALDMVRRYARAARALGIRFATGLNNCMFTSAPAALRAQRLPDPTHRRGNSGNPICPSNPAGHAYLMENAQQLFLKLSESGVDILVLWPYDEGGCACENCRPWGSNGYLKLSRDFAALGRTYF